MNNFQLEKIELREIELPLKNAFETSFGVTTKRRVIVVKVTDADGAVGFGECTAMERPFYNHETVDSAWSTITTCIVPLLASAHVSSADEVGSALSPIQGNRMAVAAVETAIWDLEAKRFSKPLWSHIGGTLSEINCGVSIGLQESPEHLVERVAAELSSGYQRIKVKIKPGKDVEFVKAVRNVYPDITLSADANSAYDLTKDIATLRELDNFDLLMIEQPLTAGDLLDHAKLQRSLKTAICLDESITSLRDALQALEMGACRIINIKLGRVGGHTAARKIQALAKEKEIPVWCGGMLETGIGRAHNIAMSTLDGFTLPGDVSASSRYWEQDIIDPPVVVSDHGTITAPSSPGIGYGVNDNEIDRLTTRREELRLHAARSFSS
ncbi:MAG TPA: o-succinylbenzoate synthase [Pyrinomonadaceae bacterium]|nr:o-succinylbenzoate synthase [Pyrinomonadaceae bacterium]